jgi:hypothetical protein
MNWWSIPQAVVWIVTRSDAEILRADRTTVLSQVARLALRPASDAKGPPVSARAAVDELQRAWHARRLALAGRANGRGPSASVAAASHLRIQDHRDEVCVGDDGLYRGAGRFWSDLWVRADDCRRCWPAPSRPGVTTSASPPARSAGPPADDVVVAFMDERRKAFRADGRKAGREELLKAAMLRFGLPRKVALDIWRRAPHDRKGGRPKAEHKTWSGTGRSSAT